MFPNLLSAAVLFSLYTKMSVVDLESLSNDNLRKRVVSLISLEYWSDSPLSCSSSFNNSSHP